MDFRIGEVLFNTETRKFYLEDEVDITDDGSIVVPKDYNLDLKDGDDIRQFLSERWVRYSPSEFFITFIGDSDFECEPFLDYLQHFGHNVVRGEQDPDVAGTVINLHEKSCIGIKFLFSESATDLSLGVHVYDQILGKSYLYPMVNFNQEMYNIRMKAIRKSVTESFRGLLHKLNDTPVVINRIEASFYKEPSVVNYLRYHLRYMDGITRNTRIGIRKECYYSEAKASAWRIDLIDKAMVDGDKFYLGIVDKLYNNMIER